MKHFFQTLLLWALLVLTCALFYIAVTFPFAYSLMNICLFVSACFTLIQACGIIDKRHGFGEHNKDENDDDDTK
jgi:hypothetical protein